MATQSQLNAIKAAIAAGVTEVTYDGVTTKYRTLAEMRDIRDELMIELGQGTARQGPYQASFSKGYR